jgi:ribosome-associated toxin RatA of RatAB toxin-antitoxin module
MIMEVKRWRERVEEREREMVDIVETVEEYVHFLNVCTKIFKVSDGHATEGQTTLAVPFSAK